MCHVQKMRVASARRNIRVGFRTAGTRARTKFLKTTYCTRNVQEMYRNVQDENVQRNVQELRRFGQKCTTNVQEFCDGFVQKRSKPRDRFRGALTAPAGEKVSETTVFQWFLTRFELTVLNGLT